MRFGKKRSPAAVGRGTLKPTQASVSNRATEPVRPDTPLPFEPEEENVVSPQDDISQISGDPIQQLFTTLGKFHRHLNKAQHAPDGAGWCDECMNELMVGLEISIAREWTPIKDALIDAARILHSYEEAGKAGMCVSFLKDSYELLSLMVGDLIVDTVRAGVKQKWREHYMRAVAELESRGIPLVEDEEREVAEPPPVTPNCTPAPPPEKHSSPEIKEEQEPEKEDENKHDHQDAEETTDDAAQKLAADLDSMSFDMPAFSDTAASDDAPNDDKTEGGIVPFPSTSKQEDTPFEESPVNDVLEEQDLLKLDGLQSSEKEELPQEEAADKIEKEVAQKESEATPPETEYPVKIQREETPKDETPPETNADETATETEPAEIAAQPEKSPPTQASNMPPQKNEATEALLQRVQAALTSGDTRNTKAMALELAVAMAQLEHEQARQDLASSEQLLLENKRVIEQNEAKVIQMENDLLRTEELLEARDSECSANREGINALDEEIGALSSELADIDAQIVTLQQKRVEQQNRIDNKRTEHEEAIAAESRTRTELEALNQETETIKEHLEEARKEARASHGKQRDIEVEILRAQEEMEARRLSLETIENTLNPGKAVSPKEAESESLL